MWTKKDESGENEESDQPEDSEGASESAPPLFFLPPFLAPEVILHDSAAGEEEK